MSEMEHSAFEAFADTIEETDNGGAQAPLSEGASFKDVRKNYYDALYNESVRLLETGEIDLDEADIRYSTAMPMRKVREASVCIIGAGGLGNWQWRTLASMGFKRIIIYDADTVGIENVGSQCHSVHELGEPKVDAVARAALEYRSLGIITRNKIVEYEKMHPLDFIEQDLGFIPDIVIGCTDNTEFRNSMICGMYSYIRNAYNNRKSNSIPMLWLDYRMSLGDWTCYAIPMRSFAMAMDEHHENASYPIRELFSKYVDEAVFPKSAAVHEHCTERAISYTGENVGSFTGAMMHWWFKNGEAEFGDNVLDKIFSFKNGDNFGAFRFKTSFSAKDFEFITETANERLLAKKIRMLREESSRFLEVVRAAMGYDTTWTLLGIVNKGKVDETVGIGEVIINCKRPETMYVSVGNNKFLPLARIGRTVCNGSIVSSEGIGTQKHLYHFRVDSPICNLLSGKYGEFAYNRNINRSIHVVWKNDEPFLESIQVSVNNASRDTYVIEKLCVPGNALPDYISGGNLSSLNKEACDVVRDKIREYLDSHSESIQAAGTAANEQQQEDIEDELEYVEVARSELSVGDIVRINTGSGQLGFTLGLVLSTTDGRIQMRDLIAGSDCFVSNSIQSFELISFANADDLSDSADRLMIVGTIMARRCQSAAGHIILQIADNIRRVSGLDDYGDLVKQALEDGSSEYMSANHEQNSSDDEGYVFNFSTASGSDLGDSDVVFFGGEPCIIRRINGTQCICNGADVVDPEHANRVAVNHGSTYFRMFHGYSCGMSTANAWTTAQWLHHAFTSASIDLHRVKMVFDLAHNHVASAIFCLLQERHDNGNDNIEEIRHTIENLTNIVRSQSSYDFDELTSGELIFIGNHGSFYAVNSVEMDDTENETVKARLTNIVTGYCTTEVFDHDDTYVCFAKLDDFGELDETPSEVTRYVEDTIRNTAKIAIDTMHAMNGNDGSVQHLRFANDMAHVLSEVIYSYYGDDVVDDNIEYIENLVREGLDR